MKYYLISFSRQSDGKYRIQNHLNSLFFFLGERCKNNLNFMKVIKVWHLYFVDWLWIIKQKRSDIHGHRQPVLVGRCLVDLPELCDLVSKLVKLQTLLEFLTEHWSQGFCFTSLNRMKIFQGLVKLCKAKFIYINRVTLNQ